MIKYINKKVEARCPVCNCSEGILFWTVEASNASAHFLSSKKDNARYLKLTSHIEKLWNKSNCEVIKCVACEFVYSFPYVAGDKLFYDLAYERGGCPDWKWEFEKAFNIISVRKINQPRVLEIGVGIGTFICKLVDTITDAKNVVAIEYSDYGRKQIKDRGVNCFSRDIKTLTEFELGGKFDYICLFQTLEHLDNINDLLKIFSTHLNHDGEIILAVPNEKRIQFNELNGALLDMPPNHIGRWTNSAFQYYADSNGFSVIEHQYEPANFLSAASQFLMYRLLKASQNTRSLSHYLVFREKSLLKSLGIRFIVLLDALFNLNKLIKLAVNINAIGGDSQFVRLRKAC
jgi:SAM-dependent methyltransferase